MGSPTTVRTLPATCKCPFYRHLRLQDAALALALGKQRHGQGQQGYKGKTVEVNFAIASFLATCGRIALL
jgi:hypothetical protein